MARKLTKKEKGFVKDYLATGNGTQAALNNYDTESINTAGVIASENLSKPKIQLALNEAFPDSELYKLHREGLFEEDLLVRHKYLDTAYKLKGSYAPDKHVSLNVELIPSDKIRELADRLLVIQSKHEERRKDDTSTKG